MDNWRYKHLRTREDSGTDPGATLWFGAAGRFLRRPTLEVPQSSLCDCNIIYPASTVYQMFGKLRAMVFNAEDAQLRAVPTLR